MSTGAAARQPSRAELLRSLGPGIVTGAADDDPSGIATYTITGARFGYEFVWSAPLTWPLMASVQLMSAQVAMSSGRGLAGAFRMKFPRWLVGAFAVALFAANTINIASDLAGMGDAAAMLLGGRPLFYAAAFGIVICLAAVRLHYRQLARFLQWLALALFAYVAAGVVVDVDWHAALRGLLPRLPHGGAQWSALVAILGTTVSPYLFYWQAGQEVEEQKARGRRTIAQRRRFGRREFTARRLDVALGSFISNLIMFFIIVTAAATLHAAGITHVETARQAAEALRPIAGASCYWLFSAGLIGTGLLAIPTLAGSAAYAFAETFGWPYGLDNDFHHASSFYTVFILATVAAIAIAATRINPMTALFWSAMINGLLAPLVLICMYRTATDAKIMGGRQVSGPVRGAVALTITLMLAAGVGMFVL